MQFKLSVTTFIKREFYCETFNIKKKVEKIMQRIPHLIITQILLIKI